MLYSSADWKPRIGNLTQRWIIKSSASTSAKGINNPTACCPGIQYHGPFRFHAQALTRNWICQNVVLAGQGEGAVSEVCLPVCWKAASTLWLSWRLFAGLGSGKFIFPMASKRSVTNSFSVVTWRRWYIEGDLGKSLVIWRNRWVHWWEWTLKT